MKSNILKMEIGDLKIEMMRQFKELYIYENNKNNKYIIDQIHLKMISGKMPTVESLQYYIIFGMKQQHLENILQYWQISINVYAECNYMVTKQHLIHFLKFIWTKYCINMCQKKMKSTLLTKTT